MLNNIDQDSEELIL